MFDEIGNNKTKIVKRPAKNHKTESPKAKAKKASKKYKERYDVISVSFPKFFKEYMDSIQKDSLVNVNYNTQILLWLSETSAMDGFKQFLAKKEELKDV
jgi:hypothetical protein